ncbi:Hpt domain-containing protein [Pseudarthrobacter sp. NPDC080039]|uniref:Hpt domain-containing protein n=1 Tax=unclassified Pseudarthrobacter TaxID=2647000 RepID=UPI003450EAC0
MEEHRSIHVGGQVLDTDALTNLAEQLQSVTAARNYAEAFVGLLQKRYERILEALGHNDIPASLNAVLSLKVNAHMVGALAIEQTCQTLHRYILAGDTPAAAQHAPLLSADIHAAKDAITDFLTRTPR